MDNNMFDEITNDIIEQIRNIHYEESEKQIMLSQILFNFIKMNKDLSTYIHIISLLEEEEKERKEQSNSKKLKKFLHKKL